MRNLFGLFVHAVAAALTVLVPVAVSSADCPSNRTFVVEYSYDIDGQPIPVLSLTTGYTYTFDLRNPSLHPFMLTASPSGGPGTSPLPMSAGVGCVCQGCGTCTRRTLTFTPAASLAGSTVYYQCTVHAGMGNAIHILPAPSITVNTLPLPLNRCAGEDAEFIVSATSNETESLAYEWRRDGQPLLDVPGRITGVNSSRLAITGATTGDQGAITCVITAPCKTVTTAPVAFTVAGCCPADIGLSGGHAGSDGNLNNNDFVVFIEWFFSGEPRADIGVQGGLPGTDGQLDNNDFIAFIDRFFTGC